MKQKTLLLFALTLLSRALFAEMDIPEAGRIRVDGSLSDWSHVQWIPLDQVITGTPTNLSNARWTAAWDEDSMIYLAIQYDDADLALQPGTNATDGVEIYVRGNTSSTPSAYSEKQQSAQRYTIGLSPPGELTSIQLGSFEKIPVHNRVAAAVIRNGTTLTYEIKVPVYDTFDITTRNKCSESELFVGEEIGLDIAIIDASKTGGTGMLGDNRHDKRTDANQIAEHTLDE